MFCLERWSLRANAMRILTNSGLNNISKLIPHDVV